MSGGPFPGADAPEELPARVAPTVSGAPAGCFHFILLSAGAGAVRVAGKAFHVNAPAVLCLSDDEAGGVSWDESFTATAVSFLPALIDSRFSHRSLLEREQPRDLAERLEADSFRAFTAMPRPDSGILVLAPGETPVYSHLFTELRELSTNFESRFAPCRFRSCLLSLLHLTGYRPTEPEPASTGSQVPGVTAWLEAHFTEHVTIGELCREFATNRTTLMKTFRESTGTTVGAFLAARRIELACRLLAGTKLPVSEIALRCGYGDPTHFGRLFRARTGKTPSEFRSKGR